MPGHTRTRRTPRPSQPSPSGSPPESARGPQCGYCAPSRGLSGKQTQLLHTLHQILVVELKQDPQAVLFPTEHVGCGPFIDDLTTLIPLKPKLPHRLDQDVLAVEGGLRDTADARRRQSHGREERFAFWDDFQELVPLHRVDA